MMNLKGIVSGLAICLCMSAVPSTSNAEKILEINAEKFTCNDLKAMVKKHKIIHMYSRGWGGRFASNKKHCERTDRTIDNAYLFAKDGALCSPGLWCRMKWPGE